jgi:hypothetical protein
MKEKLENMKNWERVKSSLQVVEIVSPPHTSIPT